MSLDQIPGARPGPSPDGCSLSAADQCASDRPGHAPDDSAFSLTVMMPSNVASLSGQASAGEYPEQ